MGRPKSLPREDTLTLTPESLSYNGCNTYLLYMERQKLFATWLVTAAAEFRELVRREPQQPTDTITYSQALRLARIVAHRGTIPPRVISYLNYMLHLRGNWDPGNQKKPKIGATDEPIHVHFLAMVTLRTIRNILALAPAAEEESDASNRPPTKAYSFYPLPGEAFFAWVCFFNDLAVIRAYLRTYWDAYKHAFETLTTRTLITNTAIRLIRGACDTQIEATRHLPGMPEDEGLICEWILHGVTGQAALYKRPRYGDWERYEADWCCHEVLYAIEQSIRVLGFTERDPFQVASLPHGKFKALRYSWAKAVPYGIKRTDIIGDFIFTTCFSLHQLRLFYEKSPEDTGFLPCFDEISMGWLTWEPYLDERKFPLWLAISFQIWVDIMLQLGEYSPTALDDLKEQASDRIDLYRAFFQNSRTEKASKSDKSEGLSVISMIAKCVRKDHFKGKIQSVRDEWGVMLEPMDDFFFLETHPLLCGMQSWWLEQEYRHFEWGQVSLYESIAPAAILYHSMVRSGLVDNGEWPDIDYTIATRTNEIFIHYRNGKPVLKLTDPMLMECLGEQFRDTSSEPSLYDALTQDLINPITCFVSNIFACYFEYGLADYGAPSREQFFGVGLTNKTLDTLLRQSPSSHRRQLMRASLAREGVLNLISVLDLVTTARYYDEELDAFDWFAMHDRCQMFFDKIRDNFMNNYMAFQSELPFHTFPPPILVRGGAMSSGGAPYGLHTNIFASILITLFILPRDNPTGLDYTPRSRSDGPYSLDALYYLLFDKTSFYRTHNLILAALCLNAALIPASAIPLREYLFERWKYGIKRHADILDISVESAAAILRPLFVEEGVIGWVRAVGRQHKHYKKRAPMHPDDVEHYRDLRRRRCRAPWHFMAEEEEEEEEELDSSDGNSSTTIGGNDISDTRLVDYYDIDIASPPWTTGCYSFVSDDETSPEPRRRNTI
ncbi:hypothetical protein O1611_g6599 [Lasiodiplodia mahajangana]|uniref:Uncharacterized protein n=1 Tax=Lasiodiplodia mahajangana TaxID=1108764 RepID=A0ACC2JI23_9PEZI|nr:hypothetical protein O1611_g6599 [Lasiodiplodia mahajangana]